MKSDEASHSIFSFSMALALLLLILCVSCATMPEVKPNSYASPAPDEEYKPSPVNTPVKIPEEAKNASAEGFAKKGMTLSELTDIALRNNPSTSLAWSNARAKAAEWGISRSSYYPTIGIEVDGVLGKIPQSLSGRSYLDIGTTLNYLLLDFGSRSAGAEAARQALIAADWNHNQAIQDVLRDVPQAYYIHLGYVSLVNASEKDLEEAESVLAATESRHRSGVSTISDVLQARAKRDMALYNLEAARGGMEISKGALASAIGWPSNTPFSIAGENRNLPLNAMGSDVDKLIETARSRRADLNAYMAEVRKSEAALKKAKAEPFPKLGGVGNVGWQRTKNLEQERYYGGLTLSLPIFNGFEFTNAVRAAKADLDASRSQFKAKEDSVIQEVWAAFNNYQTAATQLKASTAQLTSASESYQVSLDRYKNGAADITELLNAQSMLANSRSQLIDSRVKLFNSYAELVHAVGDSHAPSAQEIQEAELQN